MRHGAVIALSLSLFGCAAVFRGTKDTVRIESSPPGAEAMKGAQKVGPTPARVDVERKGTTQVTLSKSGYEDHVGDVRKSMNGAWLTIDIVTCPFTFCIPLLVDALTGAWFDVEKTYLGTLTPSGSAATVASASSTAEPTPDSSAPTIEMSESERKATARAAYLEGVKLQENGKCPEALPRLEAAQKFYSAPTHLLHIAQCQSATGKLVEAAETYESLVRTPLTKESPEVFRQAQEDGKRELAKIKPRIPTLRIQIAPDPRSLSSLVVKLNGNAIPNEVLGIARPVNPGKYDVTVWAAGYREASDSVEIGEGSPKALLLKLSK